MVADDVRFNEAEFIVNVSGDCREQVGRVHITEFRAIRTTLLGVANAVDDAST